MVKKTIAAIAIAMTSFGAMAADKPSEFCGQAAMLIQDGTMRAYESRLQGDDAPTAWRNASQDFDQKMPVYRGQHNPAANSLVRNALASSVKLVYIYPVSQGDRLPRVIADQFYSDCMFGFSRHPDLQ